VAASVGRTLNASAAATATSRNISRRYASPAPMLFGELRPEAMPTEKEKVLQVAMLWGDQVLNVRQFADGVPVTIGGDRKNPFQLDSTTVGNAFTLAAAQGVKRIVNIPTEADAVIRSNGKLQHAGNNAVELGLSDRVQVSVDNLSFVLQYVKPAPQAPAGKRDKRDNVFAGMALLFLVAGAALMAWMHFREKPDYAALDGLSKADRRVVKMIINSKKAPPPKLKAKVAEKEGAEEGAKVKGEEGEMGKPTEVQKKAEPSKSGTQLTDAQKKERDRQKVNNTGLLSVLKGKNGSISDQLGGGGHGGGVNQALGGLTSGGALGDQKGVGGMGARGTGNGGGGNGLTIGGLGTKGDGPGRGGSGFDINSKGKDTVRIIPGKTIVEGGLPKEVIAQIIRSHEKEIKYCYEQELNKDPSLSGKVAAFFIIDGSGNVSEASVSETSLNSPSAERCMMQKIKRWKFPEPKGGGVVTVTYPWVFKPSAGDE
jgi:outer membrane biosynthesis protein TonB